jgi:hypothetical protein
MVNKVFNNIECFQPSQNFQPIAKLLHEHKQGFFETVVSLLYPIENCSNSHLFTHAKICNLTSKYLKRSSQINDLASNQLKKTMDNDLKTLTYSEILKYKEHISKDDSFVELRKSVQDEITRRETLRTKLFDGDKIVKVLGPKHFKELMYNPSTKMIMNKFAKDFENLENLSFLRKLNKIRLMPDDEKKSETIRQLAEQCIQKEGKLSFDTQNKSSKKETFSLNLSYDQSNWIRTSLDKNGPITVEILKNAEEEVLELFQNMSSFNWLNDSKGPALKDLVEHLLT